MDLLTSPEAYLSLITLTAMEVVLGIDNIIFISVLSGRLPAAERDRGRRLGLLGAFVSRLLLLTTISWMASLVNPLFYVGEFAVSGKSIILFFGGLFLIWKATKEIHGRFEDGEDSPEIKGKVSMKNVLIQIALLDIVFSLDSVITAVGMSQHLSIMIAANVLALGVMIFTSKTIGDFVERHPTIKMLALAFLIMIGLVLVADAAGLHIPKGYIYFAMAFSVSVEMLNLKSHQKKSKPKIVKKKTKARS